MGLFLVSAFLIKDGDVKAVAVGPDEKGKYAGVIAHGDSHPFHPGVAIVSTASDYDSATEAMADMSSLIDRIKSKPLHELMVE